MRALLWLLLAAGDPRAQLEALKARKAAEEAAARLLADRERSILDTLGEAEEALAQVEGDARAAEAERARSERRVAEARAEEAEAQARLAARLTELRPRLAAWRRLGGVGELRLLVGAGSLAELVKRRALLDRVIKADLDAFQGARQALADRERAHAVRQAEAARLGALAAEARERQAEATARREERRTLLGAVRNARALHERAAVEAEGQGKKLAQFIEALPPPAAGAPAHAGFARLRGRLPHPADGPIEVGFGRVVNPRFNTVTVQKGIDIGARPGEPVRAVAPGRVAHAGWFRGYGNLVIVDHGEGFHTLVAHLASMSTAMGEEVGAGSLLGTVGDTGSLKGSYLYFEIREKGRPVDPSAWLRP